MIKHIITTLLISVLIGCKEDKTIKSAQYKYKAADLYNQATDAENWRYKYQQIKSYDNVARLTKKRDSLERLAIKYIDSAKTILK